jgi:hypothetical protein
MPKPTTSVSYCDKFLHCNTSSQISTVWTGQFSQTFSTVWTSGFLNRCCRLLLPFDAKDEMIAIEAGCTRKLK